MPKTYTVNEVAEILGYSTNSIYTFLKEKRIKGVRVGRGRFRIPEEELSRILHLSKKPVPQVQRDPASLLTSPSASFSGDAAIAMPVTEDDIPVKTLSLKNVLTSPNIFDWFIGLSAIASGLALYVFNALFGTPGFETYALYINAGKVIFVASGLGIIASTMFVGSGIWRKVFYAILILLGFANAFMLFRSGDVYGTILYGSLALVMLVSLLFRLGGIVSMGGYLSLIAILAPLVIFFSSQNSHFLTVSKLLAVSPVTLGWLVTSVCLGFLGMFWTGYFSVPVLFGFAALFSATLQFASAVFYASMGLWSRAFFLIVVGFFTAILPSWRTIQDVCSKRQRAMLHLVFVGVGGVLVAAIMVVYLLQQSIWDQNKAEFLNKVTVAQNIALESLDSVKRSMVVSAANPLLVDALGKKDTDALIQIGKVIYESNTNVRRLVFLDAKGDGLSLYPIGTFDEPNLAFRDYFIKVKETKAPYVSNVFQALADNAHRYVVVVAVPVLSAKKELVGVLTASLNLDRLGNRIQQIAIERQGEYFVILDSTNTTLYHPKFELIGSIAPADDVARRAVNGEKDVVQAKLRDGTLGLIAYAPVPELGWAVSLRAPVARARELTNNAVISVFAVVLALLCAAVVFLLLFQSKWRNLGDVGP